MNNYLELKYHPNRFSLKLDKFMSDTIPEFSNKKITKAIREIIPGNWENEGELDEIYLYQDYYLQNLEEEMDAFIAESDIFLFRNFSSRKALKGWYEVQKDFFIDYAQFLNIGSNKFEIPLFLSEMFKRTDLDKISIKDIILPYDAMYLYIDTNEEMLLDGRRYAFEGCYIIKTKSNIYLNDEINEKTLLRFFLTTSCKNIDYKNIEFANYLTNEKMLDLTMCLEEQGDFTIDEYLSWVEQDNPVPNDIWEIYYKDEYTKWKPYLLNIFSYVINSLFFICYQEEKDYEKIKIIRSKNKKKKHNNKDNCEKENTVYLCGNNFRKRYISDDDIENVLNAHSRRGHWRNQAYGKKYSQHKKIWIHPMLIHKNEEIRINHIYK